MPEMRSQPDFQATGQPTNPQPTISSSVDTGEAAQEKPIMLSAPASMSASRLGKLQQDLKTRSSSRAEISEQVDVLCEACIRHRRQARHRRPCPTLEGSAVALRLAAPIQTKWLHWWPWWPAACSHLELAGSQAKNLGSCQCVAPGRSLALKSAKTCAGPQGG